MSMISEPVPPNEFGNKPVPDLGILTEIPIPARVSRLLGRVLEFYYRRLRTPLVLIIILALIWVISTPSRDAISRWWLDMVLIVVLVILTYVVGFANVRYRNRILGVALGKPAFGSAGGLEARLFRSMLRAAPDVHLRFSSDDEAMLARVRQLDNRITPMILRHNFLQSGASSGSGSTSDDNGWDRAWDTIQNVPIRGVDISFLKFRTEYPYAENFIPIWLLSSLRSLALLDLYIPIVAWLSYRSSIGREASVAIIALDVFFSFALALSVFVIRAYGGTEIKILVPPRGNLLHSGVHDESILDEVDNLRGVAMRPLGVRLGPRYLKELRNFVMRGLILDIPVRALSIAILVAASFVVGSLISGEWDLLRSTYEKLLFVFALALLGIIGGFYVAALITQDPRSVATPILAGAISAGIPLLGQYLLTGSVGDNPGAVTIAALIGLFTVAGTVIGEIVKTSLARKEKAGSSG